MFSVGFLEKQLTSTSASTARFTFLQSVLNTDGENFLQKVYSR